MRLCSSDPVSQRPDVNSLNSYPRPTFPLLLTWYPALHKRTAWWPNHSQLQERRRKKKISWHSLTTWRSVQTQHSWSDYQFSSIENTHLFKIPHWIRQAWSSSSPSPSVSCSTKLTCLKRSKDSIGLLIYESPQVNSKHMFFFLHVLLSMREHVKFPMSDIVFAHQFKSTRVKTCGSVDENFSQLELNIVCITSQF